MTTLYVDNIAPNLQSRVSIPDHVIQVKSFVYDESTAITSTTATDTGLTLDITPSSTASKILVMADISCSGANAQFVMFDLVRNSTALYQGSDGTKSWVCSKVWYPRSESNTEGNSVGQVSFVYLDSPSTTSATTYKIQARSSYAAVTFGINNRNSDDTSLASSITLMEIAG